MTEAKRETKCNGKVVRHGAKVFILLSIILLIPLISANTFGYNYLNNQPTGNITNEYINNTYINQTLELNSTQFETGEPVTIKTSWLTSFIEGISKWLDYYTITEIDNRYSNNTGDQNLSTYVQGNMSSETTTTYTPTNGSALSFDGVNDYVSVGNSESLNNSVNISVFAWVNPSQKDIYKSIVSKIEGVYVRGWEIGSSSSAGLGKLRVTLRDGIVDVIGEPLELNKWQFIGFTYDGTNLLIYQNAINTNSTTGTSSVKNVGNLNIGTRRDGAIAADFFQGSIDEVLIFNRSLNSTEVEQLYNSGIGLYANTSIAPFNEGLVSGWHFDEGTGTTAYDLTGANNGTLTNSPSWVDGKVPHNIVTQVLGAIGLMPWVSATNFISTDFSLQWIGNALKNPWNTISTLGNSTNRWNGYFWNTESENLNVTNLTTVNNLVVTGNLSAKRPYGMFTSTETQTIISPDTAYPITFNHTEDAYLVYDGDGANISIGQTGEYKIDISAIVVTDTNNKHVEIWVQKWNGTWNNIPRSNTRVEIENAGTEQVIAVPYIIDYHIGEKFRFMWASDDAGSQLLYTTNTSYSPEVPSAIITIYKLSELTA